MLASKQPEVTDCCRSFQVEVHVIPIHVNTAAEQIPGIFMGILSPARYFPPTFVELLYQYLSSGAHRPPFLCLQVGIARLPVPLRRTEVIEFSFMR